MKRTKLLTPILGLTTLSTVIVPTITSCSNQQNHVWLSSVDGIKKDADGNYSANYYFGLDKDTYTDKDIDVIINSSNRFDFKLTHFVTSKLLVVNVLYVKHPDEDITAQFDLRIWTNNWSQQINWLEMNVPKYEVTIDDYITAYTAARNHFLQYEQRRYNTFKLATGDYFTQDGTKLIVTNTSTQANEIVYTESVEGSGVYDKISFGFNVDGTKWGYSVTNDLSRTPAVQKAYLEALISLYKVKPTFYVLKNGSYGFSYEAVITSTQQTQYLSYYELSNAQGYYVEYRDSLQVQQGSKIVSSSERSYHLSNFEEKE